MHPLIIAIVIIVIGAGVEFFTRSAPSPIRWGLLAVVGVLAVWWLATLLGLGL